MRPHFPARILVGALAALLAGCDGVAGDLDKAEQPPVVPGVVIPPILPVAGRPQIAAFSCTPQSGPAPLVTTCRIGIIHPDSQPVKCSLSVDDGRPAVLDAVDCSTSVTREVTFERAGSFVLTLLVRDELGATAQEVRPVSVAERPNDPPVIASFTATPASGTIPLSTAFTWAASDPDGDALTCSIDVGNDGTVEYPAVDCAAATQAHTLATAGTEEVLLVVTDARGLAAQKVITLTGRTAVGDVRIAKVEWGQSVVLETLRLVQGKSALLRLHVLGDKAGLAGVVVEAEGFSGAGASLGTLTLVGPASPPIAVVPADLKQQWTATVPAAWVEAGLEVRVRLDPLDALPETDESNNELIARPTVGRGNVLQLTSVPVVHQGVTGTVIDIEPIMVAMWPVKAIANTTRAPYTFSGTLLATSTGEWGNLLQNIAAIRAADGSNRNYYGWVKVGYGSGIAGIGYIGQEAATGRDNSVGTAAHELGHNLGRNHAPCGGVAGADANFPYAGGKIGSWGYNASSKLLLNPATYVDLMSYCNPAWVSDYNYKAVQNRLEASAYIPSGGASLYAPVVMVAGTIRNQGTEVALRPVQRMVAAVSASGDGAWAVRLVTLDGKQTIHAFTPAEVSDDGAGEQHFTLTLPDPGPLAAVEVLRGSTVVERALGAAGVPLPPRLIPAGPAAMRLIWESAHFGSAQIAHLAADGTRTTLGLWLTGGDVLIRTDGLVGGTFELGVSSGVNTARWVVDTDR